MSDLSHNLSLPFLMPSQAQKHVTHNEALQTLDALVHLSVISRSQASPPIAPEDGARYLVAGGEDSVWGGQEGRIACFLHEAWVYYMPRPGWVAWIADEGRAQVFDGHDWRDVVDALDQLGINANADHTNRFAVGGSASLFDGIHGSHQLKINKMSSTDTGAVMFQTGYSGRAEFGLTGSDNIELKISPDGASWTTALAVDGSTGRVGIGKPAGMAPLEVGGGVRCLSPNAAFLQLINSGPGGTQAWIGVPDWNRSSFYIYGSTGDIMAVYDAPSRSQRLYAGGSEQVRLSSNGDVGIGISTPSTRLHINGPVRVGSYAKAALPAAASVGAGAIAYVSDAAGGAQLACSDGTQWLQVRDGLAV